MSSGEGLAGCRTTDYCRPCVEISDCLPDPRFDLALVRFVCIVFPKVGVALFRMDFDGTLLPSDAGLALRRPVCGTDPAVRPLPYGLGLGELPTFDRLDAGGDE